MDQTNPIPQAVTWSGTGLIRGCVSQLPRSLDEVADLRFLPEEVTLSTAEIREQTVAGFIFQIGDDLVRFDRSEILRSFHVMTQAAVLLVYATSIANCFLVVSADRRGDGKEVVHVLWDGKM